MKKWVTILIIVIVLGVLGLVLGLTSKQKQESEYQKEFDMIVQTERFLKTKVNYPESFEYINYPNVEWYDDGTIFVIISGRFKSSNAFGVYSSHNFAVAMNPKNFSIISYKIV